MAEKDTKGEEGAAGAASKEVVLKPGEVAVPSKVLAEILEKQATMEQQIADGEAKREGMEAMFAEQSNVDTNGEKKLRVRKNFEPAFRTVGIKKYPIAGDVENLGYVIGWTNRGAYQKVDKTGVAPVIVDYIDIFYLGKEHNAEGKLEAESVPLLSLINATEVNCKVIDIKDENGNTNKPMYVPELNPESRPGLRKVPTGEEIHVTTFDPKHGLIETGDVIDGWVGFTDRTYVIQIPGIAEAVEIDEKYVNI